MLDPVGIAFPSLLGSHLSREREWSMCVYLKQGSKESISPTSGPISPEILFSILLLSRSLFSFLMQCNPSCSSGSKYRDTKSWQGKAGGVQVSEALFKLNSKEL